MVEHAKTANDVNACISKWESFTYPLENDSLGNGLLLNRLLDAFGDWLNSTDQYTGHVVQQVPHSAARSGADVEDAPGVDHAKQGLDPSQVFGIVVALKGVHGVIFRSGFRVVLTLKPNGSFSVGQHFSPHCFIPPQN
jgi:hypothetical protein